MPDGRGAITVIRAADRYLSRLPGITARHCFSYGDHYDPDNVAFGALRAINEEQIEPGAGYEAHRHSDTEIVTWVLDGALAHEDSAGNRGVLVPGQIQLLSAGAGVEHAEWNASPVRALRFVQMMLDPSPAAVRAGPLPPAYHLDQVAAGSCGQLVLALTVRPGVELHVGWLRPGETFTAPAGGDVHLQVTRASVDLEGVGPVEAGDSVRAVDSAGLEVCGLGVDGTTSAEVLLWRLAGGPQ